MTGFGVDAAGAACCAVALVGVVMKAITARHTASKEVAVMRVVNFMVRSPDGWRVRF